MSDDEDDDVNRTEVIPGEEARAARARAERWAQAVRDAAARPPVDHPERLPLHPSPPLPAGTEVRGRWWPDGSAPPAESFGPRGQRILHPPPNMRRGQDHCMASMLLHERLTLLHERLVRLEQTREKS